MAFQLSPGVRVTERDLSAIIPAVSSTPAAMVGLFNWGPANQRVIVTSENELYQLFSGPDSNTFPYFFTAANFLRYGNNIQVVRAISGASNAVAGGATGTTGYLITNRDFYDATTFTVANGSFAAKYPGVFGNSLQIHACDGTTGFGLWSLSGQFSSAPGTSTFVQGIAGNVNDEIHIAVIDEDGLFSGATGNILEIYQGLSKATDARKSDGTSNYYKTVLNNSSKYVYFLSDIGGITSKTIAAVGSYGVIGATVQQAQPANGSTAGLFISSMTGGGLGTMSGLGSTIAAAYNTYFGNADAVDVSLLLCGPLTGSDAATVCSVASTRKDCMAFASVVNSDPTEVSLDNSAYARSLAQKTAIGNNNYAFIDSGYKLMYDRYNDTTRWVPLNGDIGGLCARTDSTNDPWWSPAGFNRGNIKDVIKLGWNPNSAYRDLIYPQGINPVVTFPGDGTVLFGDRTAQSKPSAFDRINVRRLFIVLEKAIAIAAKYQLFEFNDAFTRSMFVSMVEPYLRDVQARRGIYNFKVICDETNNTSVVIDSNNFVADIFLQPARSINAIQLNFVATRTGVSFEEIATLSRPTV